MADIDGIKIIDQNFEDKANHYSKKYNIPILDNHSNVPCLVFDNNVSLHFQTTILKNSFNTGRFKTRISNFQSEVLIKKAIGFSEKKQQTILDITGGLGHDAFIMSLLGEKVTLVEKNKGLCVLIEEALNSLPSTPYFSEAQSRITIINADSRKFVSMANEFDVIFADPMFNSNKKLKRTQQMEFLDNYLEEYDDPSLDFHKTSFKRMVVKKELKSLSGIKEGAAISFKGTSIKFDVYHKGEI